MIRKAVIPAAGFGTRLYPASKIIKKEFFPIVDIDGVVKPAIQLIIEEAIESGIEEVCIIIRENDRPIFTKYFSQTNNGDLEERISKLPWAYKESKNLMHISRRLSYIVQESQEGFGHAVYCARNWVGSDPFLLMLGDHVYISNTDTRCAKQLIDVFEKLGENVCAVMRTPENLLHLYGTIGGKSVEGFSRVYKANEIKEKPTIEYAESRLQTEGIPVGEYLCFFGQYILLPEVFTELEYLIENDIRERGEIQLTSALEMIRRRKGVFYVYETDGNRYDIGTPINYANTVSQFVKYIK